MPALSGNRGFSLVEVMVALVISLFLMGGLIATFSSTNKSYSELTKTSAQIENGRHAMTLLTEDIQHAGYFGEYVGEKLKQPDHVPTSAPNPCENSIGEFRDQLSVPVYGFEGAAASPLSCLPNYKPNTDVLVIRRVSTVQAPKDALVSGRIYLQGFMDDTPSPVVDFGGSGSFTVKYTSGKYKGGDVPIRRFIEHVYYISTCSECNGDTIPTLYRLELGENAVRNAVPLVEGIENMQLRYGIDNQNTGAPTLVRQIVHPYLALMQLKPDWVNVVTVEVNLLARNTEGTTGHRDYKTYVLGDVTLPASYDDKRRHVFSQVVRVINPAGRKEWGLFQ